ncbi:large-conductance mechanosensitive channel [Endogone sp. FLAS-F59071]|nr:large-conductance mechanosensitive channel [Endogone sp. FLAS-F59071]|eukprot:RUS21149.1 large-conductance mechanosensitive channel [Endogone sp. FLAS-F59071]
MAQTAAAANLARSVQNYQAASHGFKLYTELKDFINERGGNVLDLGIGIIIGGAFGATVTSFVSDILTPPLGLLIHGSNLENYFWVLQPGKTPNATYHSPQEAQADGAVTENIGRFLSNIINFCLICFTLFWIAYDGLFTLVCNCFRLKLDQTPSSYDSCPQEGNGRRHGPT